MTDGETEAQGGGRMGLGSAASFEAELGKEDELSALRQLPVSQWPSFLGEDGGAGTAINHGRSCTASRDAWGLARLLASASFYFLTHSQKEAITSRLAARTCQVATALPAAPSPIWGAC